MKYLLLTLMFALFASACSGPKSAGDVSDDPAGLELAEADDLLNDGDFEQSLDEPDDLFSEESEVADVEPATEEPMVAEEASEDMVSEEPAAEEPMVVEQEEAKEEEMLAAAEPMMEDSKPVIEDIGSERSYTVGKNETLMLISFKLYGDYLKWRELLNNNSAMLNGRPGNLKAGMKLTYYHTGEDFVWNPGGNPYLIKTGDTLGTISNDVYGVMKRWKEIWHHNEPLIKDPNKIFVGFTIYYLEDGRGVASPL